MPFPRPVSIFVRPFLATSCVDKSMLVRWRLCAWLVALALVAGLGSGLPAKLILKSQQAQVCLACGHGHATGRHAWGAVLYHAMPAYGGRRPSRQCS